MACISPCHGEGQGSNPSFLAMKIDQNLVGKTLTVLISDRDFNGKVIWNKTTTIKGKCKFAGFNKLLGHDQVTIDRTPIWPIVPDMIIKVE